MSFISLSSLFVLLAACNAPEPAPPTPPDPPVPPGVPMSSLDLSHLVVKGSDEERVGHVLTAKDGLWMYVQPRPYFATTGPDDFNGVDLAFVANDVEIGRFKMGFGIAHVTFLDAFSTTGVTRLAVDGTERNRIFEANIVEVLSAGSGIGGFMSLYLNGLESRSVPCGDVNGDGIVDVCTTSLLGYSPFQFSDPELREATADVTWQADYATVAAATDLNGDGRDEVYVGYSGGLVRVDDQGTGALDLAALTAWFAGSPIQALASADLAGDGERTLLVGIENEVWLLDGQGATTLIASNLPGAVWALAAGDVDGDGSDELIIGAPPYVVIADGDGTWRSWWGIDADLSGTVGTVLAVADLNLDGFDDLLIGSPGYITQSADAGGIFRLDGPL